MNLRINILCPIFLEVTVMDRGEVNKGDTVWIWDRTCQHLYPSVILLVHKKRKTWKGVGKRWRWKKTAVRLQLCNSARGCSVRHNSPPSTRRNSNCRNASAARYSMWNDSKWTGWNTNKFCIVTLRQSPAMHLNIYNLNQRRQKYKPWWRFICYAFSADMLLWFCY